MKNILITLTLGLVFSLAANAQTNFELTQDNSKISVTGTSSLHDWEVNAESFSGNADVVINEGQLEAIESLTLTVEVTSLKSGKGLMDSKTHDAFNAKKNPRIVFELNDIAGIENGNIQGKGTLNMAGASNEIPVSGTYEVDGDGNLLITGTKKLKMSDFKMKPPTAMMGTIKTGDEVEVTFSVLLKKNKELTNK